MKSLGRVGRVSLFGFCVAIAACSGGGDNKSSSNVGQCTELCQIDEDCAELLVCNDNRCSCANDELCQAKDTWSNGCASSDDCYPGYGCIEWGGTTFCVWDDSESFGCGIGSTETKVTANLAEGGTIQVCISTAMKCLDGGSCGYVPNPCEDDGDCAFAAQFGTPHCDVVSGRCVCVDDPEDSCTANHPGMQCKTDGYCGCLEDSLCYGGTGGHCFVDTGECGCLDDEACEDGFVCHERVCRCNPAAEYSCGFIFTDNPGTTYECVRL
jgi:hypothetical protein